jgi:hypothetical protein
MHDGGPMLALAVIGMCPMTFKQHAVAFCCQW